MAIINGKSFAKKEKFKAIISSEILQEINDYCAWANIKDLGFFIEEAASFIFSKDKEWKDHKRAIKRSKNKEAV